MLTDELPRLRTMSADPLLFSRECGRIRKAWQEALFSDTGQHGLERYLNHHLKGISALSDTLTSDLFAGELNDLISTVLDYCGGRPDPALRAPVAYIREWQALKKHALTDRWLNGLRADLRLKEILAGYLHEMMETGTRFTFSAMGYFERIEEELLNLVPDDPATENKIHTVLAVYNFNHLGYLGNRQDAIRERISGANGDKSEILSSAYTELLLLPQSRSWCYHPDWPGLQQMLSAWIQEEMTMGSRPGTAAHCPAPKLLLRLSVAQTACWIRLFYEQELFDTQNLSEIFRFYTQHYRTKRQETVSCKSLSKEFYDIDQVTAAVVRDQLLKMVARINRDFFPV